MKTVILHYHLFKNAGTSLDASLKENFSAANGEWVTKEFPGNYQENQKQLKQWIIDNPQAQCFSSHTATLPPPQIEGVKVIPVIFFRNPIDRIVSAYTFEAKQNSDNYGSTLARNTSLGGYIETRLLSKGDRQCRDFHAHRFAMMYQNQPGTEGERAKQAIEALPFVGIVEQYSDSLERLENLLKAEGFIDIKLKPVEANVSRTVKKSIDEKIAEIKEQLGDEAFATLVEANKVDLEIWGSLGR